MGLWIGRPRNSSSTSSRSLPCLQTGSRSKTLLCRDTEKFLFDDEVSPLSEEIKNEWSHTCTPPYVLRFVQVQLQMYLYIYLWRNLNRQVYEDSQPSTTQSVEWNTFHQSESRSDYRTIPHILWEQDIFAFAQKLGHVNPCHVATAPLL